MDCYAVLLKASIPSTAVSTLVTRGFKNVLKQAARGNGILGDQYGFLFVFSFRGPVRGAPPGRTHWPGRQKIIRSATLRMGTTFAGCQEGCAGDIAHAEQLFAETLDQDFLFAQDCIDEKGRCAGRPRPGPLPAETSGFLGRGSLERQPEVPRSIQTSEITWPFSAIVLRFSTVLISVFLIRATRFHIAGRNYELLACTPTMIPRNRARVSGAG